MHTMLNDAKRRSTIRSGHYFNIKFEYQSFNIPRWMCVGPKLRWDAMADEEASVFSLLAVGEHLCEGVCCLATSSVVSQLELWFLEAFVQPCNTDLVGPVEVPHGWILAGFADGHHCLIIFMNNNPDVSSG